MLIDGFLALDDAAEAVVDPGQVAARIVHVPGAVFGSGAPGGQVAVAQGGQRLPVAFVRGIEALVGQQPRVRDDQPDVQLTDILNNDVGARGFQRRPAPRPVDAHHQAEAPAAAGLHPGDGIRDDHRPGGHDLQPARRLEDEGRGRLARDITVQGRLAVHDVVEHIPESRGGHDRPGIAAGGGQDHGNPPRPKPLQQGHRSGEHPDRTAAEQVFEQFVLALREAEHRPLAGPVRRRPLREGGAPGCQEGGHAVLPGPALDKAGEVAIGEGAATGRDGDPRVLQGLVEELFPRRLSKFGRVRHHPVQVEDDGVDGRQRSGNCGRLRHG